MSKPRSDAKSAIIQAMQLEQHFNEEWLNHNLREPLVEQLLACKDNASRRLLLEISQKGDPGRIPALNVRKPKPPQNQPLPRERKTACHEIPQIEMNGRKRPMAHGF